MDFVKRNPRESRQTLGNEDIRITLNPAV